MLIKRGLVMSIRVTSDLGWSVAGPFRTPDLHGNLLGRVRVGRMKPVLPPQARVLRRWLRLDAISGIETFVAFDRCRT